MTHFWNIYLQLGFINSYYFTFKGYSSETSKIVQRMTSYSRMQSDSFFNNPIFFNFTFKITRHFKLTKTTENYQLLWQREIVTLHYNTLINNFQLRIDTINYIQNHVSIMNVFFNGFLYNLIKR
jgi:hypothetical protein